MDNSKTIVSFSFDDGRVDNISLAKGVLLPYMFPATFNITTGYVDGTAIGCLGKCDVEPMSIEDVKWLNDQGYFEIALHGDKHLNKAEDVEKGRRKLCEWLNLPEDTSFGFASPSSAFCANEYDHFFDSDLIKYIRIGENKNSKPNKKAVNRNKKIKDLILKKNFFSRFWNRYIDTSFYLRRYSVSLMKDSMFSNISSKIIYSIPVYRGTSPEIVINYIKYAIKKKKSLILMFHSVSEDENDNNLYTYRKKDFIKICDFLKTKQTTKCRISTVKELFEQKTKT